MSKYFGTWHAERDKMARVRRAEFDKERAGKELRRRKQIRDRAAAGKQ